ncbi:hypothetical protein CRI77_16250 [Mycolicibacterium duvalii]|uniref:Uncharacterized protein n=1 Tax=Mycolicibacterium duvalii TaxID=39688 RepID=A0A7I7K5L9_9MYCO|nr:hypothetical protein [Mycolicibacterium duvalii]MCV7367718.1 hypothetical protein [Mycolicibacterium duvalii]PEG39448.1 hypothetical protein CRI77_16250 [Mycolicibacterium duvalii]BBX18692.1 hypothetical protein MDUV_35520 [Mycolicibacterium duvalii]
MTVDEQPTPGEPKTDMVPVPLAESDPGHDLAISVTNEGMLVDGHPDVVERYINKIKEAAGQLVDVANVSKGALGNAAAAAVGAAAMFAQHGQFVQLSARSMEAIRAGNLMPGDPGFYRMTTVDNAGQFLQQLQWRQVSLGPTEMVSVQMIAVQMALKMAIAEVNDSISRVEGKVESILKLVEANRIGDVKGHHATVERMARNLDNNGALPATDWQSIAALGPDLIVTVERLRAHALRTLDDFDTSRPVQERAEILRQAVEENRLGETLNLLVVAEESLNNWQRLRLARVQDVEPEHREQVVADAFDLLATQVAEDGKLYARAAEVLESYRRTNRIDGFRYWSVRDVAKHSKQLQDDLDAFARARRHQIAQWQDLNTPSVRDAAGHVLAVAGDYAGRALNAASERIASVTSLLPEEGHAKGKETVRRTKRFPRFQRGEDQS